MEGVGGGGTGPASAAASMEQRRNEMAKVFQFYLDKSTPHALYRWIGTFVLVSLYAVRVLYIQGFYIVTYGLGIYILNLLIGFLSPLVDPELEHSDGPTLPTKGSDEFKPFIRRLPEFKFWYAITKAFCVAFVMTFFSMFDVPVFWPILLCYWLVLLFLTMKRQIMHMIKYKYVPLNVGKQKYGGKKTCFQCEQPPRLNFQLVCDFTRHRHLGGNGDGEGEKIMDLLVLVSMICIYIDTLPHT